MIKGTPNFPTSQAEINRYGTALKERALARAEALRLKDDTDEDFSNYTPGVVRQEDGYMENGAGVDVRENLRFDPETKEIQRYQYLKNIKFKDENGEVTRQQYNLTINASDSGMLGEDGDVTRAEMVIGETWFQEGVNYDGSTDMSASLTIAENGDELLRASSSKDGAFGSEDQDVGGFIVAG